MTLEQKQVNAFVKNPARLTQFNTSSQPGGINSVKTVSTDLTGQICMRYVNRFIYILCLNICEFQVWFGGGKMAEKTVITFCMIIDRLYQCKQTPQSILNKQ